MNTSVLFILLCTIFQICWSTYINKFAVHIEGGIKKANRVARETNLVNLGQIGSLNDHYLFSDSVREKRSADPAIHHHKSLSEHAHIKWFEQQKPLSRKKRDFHSRDVAEQMSVLDPYWKNQWYLHHGAAGGYDMNVMDAWRKGYTGKNVVITILDDGLERDHPDLIKNYDPYASYDINNADNDPMPRYDPSNENRHGTRCAGEVSAEANNTFCTIGVAPDSRIGGVRMLDGEVYDAVEAASLSFNSSHIDIYSASWGPDDDGKVVDGPGKLAKKAFINGIENGRGGKGSIFVWASGNGGSSDDSCNCDGYANSIYTLSISSTSEKGHKPWYLEECSSTLATTYSSGAYNERQIATTDLHGKCTMGHTGTSASAPLAAGIVALVLEANKDLTWRDIQYITLMTSKPEPMTDGMWITNGVGRKVSLRYGYGLMDASAMVALALEWNNVPAKVECLVEASDENVQLSGHTTVASQIKTDGCLDTKQEIGFLEHVQARVTLTYYRRGDVILYLTSPSGTRSKILPARPRDSKTGGFDDWPFLSVHFWGENPRGTWLLEVEDGDSFKQRHNGGTLVKWSLVLHGTKDNPVNLKHASKYTSTSTTTSTTSVSSSKQPIPDQTLCDHECLGGCTGLGPNYCRDCRHFMNDKTCVSICPDGTFAWKKSCIACESSCLTCSGPTLAQCLTCPPGQDSHSDSHTKLEKVCLQECLVGYYKSSTNSSCLKCHPNCLRCENSPSNCLACNYGQKLTGNECLPVISHFIMVLIIIISSTFILFSIIIAIIYARSNEYLCWRDDRVYGRLPIDDDDIKVKLTYADDDYLD